ncbi:hypothetical protein [Methanogenium cariaci]
MRKNETPQHQDISHADGGSGACAQGFSTSQIASGAILAEEDEQSNVVAWYDSGSLLHLLHSAAFAAICCHLFSML